MLFLFSFFLSIFNFFKEIEESLTVLPASVEAAKKGRHSRILTVWREEQRRLGREFPSADFNSL